MSFLQEAITKASKKTTERTPVTEELSPDERMFLDAVKKVQRKTQVNEYAEDDFNATDNAELGNRVDANKGLFGNKQFDVKQELYLLPETLSGDHSQPMGLLTKKDLQQYVFFRSGDIISFEWEGSDGNVSQYKCTVNGSKSYVQDIDWTDLLIQELADEGAISQR